MTELDSAAVDKAAVAFYGPAPMVNDPLRSICREHAARVITAYLAARPTPDAAAMEREFQLALSTHRRNCEVAVIRGLRGADISDRDPDVSEAKLLDLFRKAVSR